MQEVSCLKPENADLVKVYSAACIFGSCYLQLIQIYHQAEILLSIKIFHQFINEKLLRFTETYPELFQTPKMERFAKIVNGY